MRRATLEQDSQNFSIHIRKSYPITLTGARIIEIMRCLELGELAQSLNSPRSSMYSLELQFQRDRENLSTLKLRLMLDITTLPTSLFKPVLRSEQELIRQWAERVEE